MAFLHGVLESVKDDESVTKYDKNNVPNIDNVITTLHNNVGKGREAFPDAVDKVDEKTTDVFMEFSKFGHTSIVEKINSILGNQDRKLQDQLTSWRSTLTELAAQLDSLITNNVNVLDPVLRDRLMHKIDAVKSAVQVLKGSAEQGELLGKVREVDRTLEDSKIDLTNVISREHIGFYSALEKEFQGINDALWHLHTLTLKEQFTSIKDAIALARMAVDSFDAECKSTVLWHFDDIKGHVEKYTASSTTLTTNFKSVKDSVEVLEEKVIRDLDTMKNNIKKQLKAYVENGLGTHIKNALTPLTDHIAKDETTPGSLDKFIKQVKQYATEFPVRFQKKIDDMVGRIVESDGLKMYLTQYVMGKKGSGYARSDITMEKTTLTRKVSEQLKEITATPKPGSAKNVNDNMTSIKEYLRNYAGQVEEKLRMVNEIVKVLPSVMTRQPNPNPQHAEFYMNRILQTILIAVHSAVKSAADEFEEFLQQPDIDKLQVAIRDVKDVGNKIVKKVKDTTSGMTDQLGPLGNQIQSGFEEKINTAIGRDTSVMVRTLGTLMVKFVATDQTLKSAVAVVSAELDNLKNLPKIVCDGKEQSQKLMAQFKNDMNNKINYIHELVRIAESTLDAEIQGVQQSLQVACKNTKKAADRLKTEVIKEVQNAFAELTKQVHSLFAEQHIADLQALHTLVERKLEEVREIIRVDKQIGVKGLLKKMNGNRETLEEIKNNVDPSKIKTPEAIKKFPVVASDLKDFQDSLLQYIQNQVGIPSADISRPPAPTKESQLVSSIKTRLDTLLDYLKNHNDITNLDQSIKKRIYIFDEQSDKYLTELNASISALSPSKFHGFHNPLLLDALKAGMTQFTAELSHAYVNAYSGQKRTDDWVENKPVKSGEVQKTPPETQLTTEGRNCAKVCLTILETVFHDLNDLRIDCKSDGHWNNKQIYLYETDTKLENPLGQWFMDHGFTVPQDENTQDGDLNRNKTGGNIHELIVSRSNYNCVFRDDDAKKDRYGSLRKLHYYLDTFYEVTHLEHIDGAKAPCNIYQMLTWLLGLYYNPMYKKVGEYVKTLFPKPIKDDKRDYKDIPTEELNLPATSSITPKEVKFKLLQVCFLAEKILTSILGHGHADGIYAVDFYTNKYNLLYPNSASVCFDMLIDILNRVNHQLSFLLVQCQRASDDISWADCWYGRDVAGSDWKCNTLQCPNQIGSQPCNQKCDQTGDQHPNCGVKSPLQSFLEDGLQGFLPHQFKSPGCKLECTLSNHRGLPCKTPMGFTDISNMASHRKRGVDLKNVLAELCGRYNKPLSLLCSFFTCLLQRTPQTLDDLFSFYYNFIVGWGKNGIEHKSIAFQQAVNGAYFGEQYSDLDISPIFKSSDHCPKPGDQTGIQKSTHLSGDLFSLYSCDYEAESEITCGRYLQPMGLNTWLVFSKQNAGKYLSWIVYLTETFYDLLEKLLKECCDNCNKPGTKCYIKSCDVTCKVKAAYESDDTAKDLKNKHHMSDCKSIANCPLTRPTLCKYGFVFQSPHNLSGNEDVTMRRTCKDFCQTLERVLSKEKDKNDVLAKLIYETIPKFLWDIRSKFSYLLLALWSLSLLYLLHIAVVRLDVLRIRSHLRSPSSHRIAAQSLLAAARVRALANVKYFSP
ncbi:hypothetical protein, conserved [Babesia ovata]|uniref:Uncharacterized protein n=1 Tax=Babesia ovata TaxID=189622 RepID=A0A2H6KIY1_9APIC|nr:uncharacterized protein BOVATA_044400 [Babesia ovata]GBE62947.1 hypothetical protein, conserved [Babesia ovata]